MIDDKGQYPDGLRAPMIVHDREFESKLGYDEEFTFSVSDW
jgi:iron transport multicopper oxidase